jgi:hypothetical protein
MTTTTVLATNLADSGDQIAIVLVNIDVVQPDGLSTTTSKVTLGGLTYTINIPFASMITNIQLATIGTTV